MMEMNNKIIRLKPEMLSTELDKIIENKNDENIICFELSEDDLNQATGQKIVSFLDILKQKNINFKVVKPLPRCLFGFQYDKIVKEFDIPTSCKDCTDLFTIQDDGMIRFCKVLNNKLGPKFEFMKDKEQIYEYFHTFYKYLKPPKSCRNCIYFLRGKCSGFCFGVRK